jgi:hypothetical protein
MYRITQAEPLENYRMDLRFADGTHGIVDLSNLAGRGVFALWNNYAEFRNVRIGEAGELIWAGGVDLCPDALYLWLTGKKPEDIFPALQHELARA